MKHCGTKRIETPRLLLRQFTDDDCGDMLKNWISNPNVQFEYGEPVYTTISEVEKLLDKWKKGYSDIDFYRWAIIEKERMENIGQIAFCRVYSNCKTAEIEYCIGEKFWGKGYVDFFFLQDCVTDDYNHVNFWLGSGAFEYNPLPKTVEEYLSWIEKELDFVEKRNQRIKQTVKELKL